MEDFQKIVRRGEDGEITLVMVSAKGATATEFLTVVENFEAQAAVDPRIPEDAPTEAELADQALVERRHRKPVAIIEGVKDSQA